MRSAILHELETQPHRAELDVRLAGLQVLIRRYRNRGLPALADAIRDEIPFIERELLRELDAD